MQVRVRVIRWRGHLHTSNWRFLPERRGKQTGLLGRDTYQYAVECV